MKYIESMVSVVIPVYNRAHLIEYTIRSVLNQTYQNFEIIIVDDASQDKEQLLNNLHDLPIPENKLRVIHHAKNLHGGASRNSGMRIARGEYIALLDSDDLWHPEKLEKCVNLLKSNLDYDFAYSALLDQRGAEHLVFPDRGIAQDENIYDYLLFHRKSMQTSTLVLRRSQIESLNLYFDPGLRKYQDYDYCIMLGKQGLRAGFVDQPLVEMQDADAGERISNNTDIFPVRFWLDKIKALVSKKAFFTFKVDREVRFLIFRNHRLKAVKILLSSSVIKHCNWAVYARSWVQLLIPRGLASLLNRLVTQFRTKLR